MAKKIAFVGSHGTGKTTLAYDLITRLKKNHINADLSEEMARRCPLKINENAGSSTQLWILSKQITEEIEKLEKCDLLICDRSILDTYSYEVALFGEKPSWESFIKEYMKSYDLLIKVPIRDIKLIDDGTRSLDKKFQKDMDTILSDYLERFNTNYITYKGDKTIENLLERYSVK